MINAKIIQYKSHILIWWFIVLGQVDSAPISIKFIPIYTIVFKIFAIFILKTVRLLMTHNNCFHRVFKFLCLLFIKSIFLIHLFNLLIQFRINDLHPAWFLLTLFIDILYLSFIHLSDLINIRNNVSSNSLT